MSISPMSKRLVAFPHMVLNAHNVGTNLKMWNSWKVPRSASVDQMVDHIVNVASGAAGGHLKTLVLNAHGESGGIGLGRSITIDDVNKFARFKETRLVRLIIIIACEIAWDGDGGNGSYFCERLAQESGAWVIASPYAQYSDTEADLGVGYIHDWEGGTNTWNEKGECVAFTMKQ